MGIFVKITEITQILFSTVKVMYKFSQKMIWATFWPTFLQTHLVTLVKIYVYTEKLFFFDEQILIRSRTCMLQNHMLLLFEKNLVSWSWPGLPDGFFSDQKSQFGYILDDVGFEILLYTYFDHLEYFTTIIKMLRAFGNFVVIWYIFSLLWYLVPRKIWQPWSWPPPSEVSHQD
jgi:hypothetical protein